MLRPALITEINKRDECDFSIVDLFDPKIWSECSVQERRGLGRWAYNRIFRGIWNNKDWVIEILPNTNPQRYRKRKKNPTSINVNVHQVQPNIEHFAELDQFHKEFQQFSEKAGKFGYDVFLKCSKPKNLEN